MRWGQRVPQSAPRRAACRPSAEGLEARIVMVTDLAAIATAPLGVELASSNPSAGLGSSVADLGDVNGDGFSDFAVGAPSSVRNGTAINIGNGINTAAFVVFGSRSVDAGTVDWLTLNAQNRIGNLDTFSLGQTGQTNPLNGNGGFNFDGLILTASQNTNASVGTSVGAAGDVNGDGFNDILIGAAGANDQNNGTPGTGRAYLIYGGANLNLPVGQDRTIDLDNVNANRNLNIITFVNTSNNSAGPQGSQTGASVAGVGDVLQDGFPDIAIGAPNATVGGQVNAGAVYLVSGAVLRNFQTRTINLSTVGQANGTTGVIFAGAAAGDRTGFSVAGAGNVDGDTTSANQPISDILIGSPGTSANSGRATLVYGAVGLAGLATSNAGVSSIILSNVGTGTNAVPGAVFNGSGTNDNAGFAVATAGDFNADGLSDFMIGAPGTSSGSGAVTLVYGRAVASPLGEISGTFTLGSIPTTIPSVQFNGTIGSLAGFSISAVRTFATNRPNPIVIGSPGFNNGTGAVYLLPGNPDLVGTFQLANAEAQPLAGTQFTISTSASGAAFFGSAVSGNLNLTRTNQTVDSDQIGDIVIGASGFGLNTARVNAGGVFVVEGAFVTLNQPVSTVITTQIGVDSPNGPFTSINATTPGTVQIFVFSNAALPVPFRPATEIDPATIVVNGIPFPNATVAPDPVDQNGDGITDAIVTIQPRSALALVNGAQNFTITGRTRTTTANSNVRFTGTILITVVGGNGGGGGNNGGAASIRPVGLFAPFSAVPPNGERLVPTISQLSKLTYKAINRKKAFRQFLPTDGFGFRLVNFFDPIDVSRSGFNTRTSSLDRSVFTRGRYKSGQVLRFTHPKPVIPATLQTQSGPNAPRPRR